MMHADDIAEGRRLLAALTPGPWIPKDFPNTGLVFSYEADARAVLWLLQHGEQLLALAERVAAITVQTDVEQRAELARAVSILKGEFAGIRSASVVPMLAIAAPELLADAIALAALVEAVRS